MGEPKKVKEKSGNSSIRSPSSANSKGKKTVRGKEKAKGSRKYTDAEKLSVCVLYEFIKSTDRVAEMCGMEGSSVRYIVKNNKALREKAKEIVLNECTKEAGDFAGRLRETAQNAVSKLLCAVIDDTAIGKSNSQQLAIAMATLMDKFSLVPVPEEKEKSGGVIILSAVEEKGLNENG